MRSVLNHFAAEVWNHSHYFHTRYCWLVLCKKRLQVPAESRTVRSYDSLPRSPCDITSQNTMLVCTKLVLNRQHCPSQSTSRFYIEDFPLWLYHTFLQVLEDLKQCSINLTRRFRLQSVVTRCRMTESLKRMLGRLGVGLMLGVG
jgi:hypothetical protein